MFISSYDDYYRVNPNGSYIRILHASPKSPAVDVYVNNNKITSNLSYKEFTEYLSLPAGQYTVKVFPVGTTQKPLIDSSFSLPPGMIFTVTAIGEAPNISLLPVSEPFGPIIPGKTFIRFIHLSPNTPNVDITLPDGRILFKNVGYKQVTDYISVNPGTYTLNASPTGTSSVVLTVPNVNLRPNRFYSVYAVGLLGSNPPLQVLIPLDGNSYLRL